MKSRTVTQEAFAFSFATFSLPLYIKLQNLKNILQSLLFFLLLSLCKYSRRNKQKMYKSKLQELCQQRQWALPRYTAMKDGPDHNPSFRASVLLNGTAFHSSVSCKSSKAAHNEAAKSAFLHLGSSSPAAATPNPAQEVIYYM